MKGKIIIAVLAFISLSGFFACNLGIEKGFIFDEKTFNSEWNKWKNNDIQNYSFTMTGELPYWNFSRAILMFDYRVNIMVKNGIMDSFEYIGDIPYERDGETILGPEFTSISDMYQKISDYAEGEKEWWKNYTDDGGIISTKLEIKYDKQLSYITFFEPVSKWKSDYIVDTTAHAVNISNFTILDEQ